MSTAVLEPPVNHADDMTYTVESPAAAPPAAAGPKMTKAAAVREALKAGLDSGREVIDYCLTQFGVAVTSNDVSYTKGTLKAAAKPKKPDPKKTSPKKEETKKKTGKKAAKAELHKVMDRLVDNQENYLAKDGLIKSVRTLVSAHGATEVKDAVDRVVDEAKRILGQV